MVSFLSLVAVKSEAYMLLFDRYLTCEYSPAGNIVGNNNQYFKDNVQC